MKKNISIIIALIALCIGGVNVYLLHQVQKQSVPEYALHYQKPRPINPFNLTDESGQSFSNQQLLNKWSFLFFGYISCPDVCPMTMQNFSFIYSDMKNISADSQVILVSVDPHRDTVEDLKQYVGYFNPEFKALRAEHDVLYPLATNLGLIYAITGKEEAGKSDNQAYWVDHSASVVLVNPDGLIEAIFKPEQNKSGIPFINSELMLKDYQKIVALYQ